MAWRDAADYIDREDCALSSRFCTVSSMQRDCMDWYFEPIFVEESPSIAYTPFSSLTHSLACKSACVHDDFLVMTSSIANWTREISASDKLGSRFLIWIRNLICSWILAIVYMESHIFYWKERATELRIFQLISIHLPYSSRTDHICIIMTIWQPISTHQDIFRYHECCLNLLYNEYSPPIIILF